MGRVSCDEGTASSGSSQRVFLERHVRQERRAYRRRLTGCEGGVGGGSDDDDDEGGAALLAEAELESTTELKLELELGGCAYAISAVYQFNPSVDCIGV